MSTDAGAQSYSAHEATGTPLYQLIILTFTKLAGLQTYNIFYDCKTTIYKFAS